VVAALVLDKLERDEEQTASASINEEGFVQPEGMLVAAADGSLPTDGLAPEFAEHLVRRRAPGRGLSLEHDVCDEAQAETRLAKTATGAAGVEALGLGEDLLLRRVRPSQRQIDRRHSAPLPP